FPVTLDGTTQPGFAGTPIVQIDGSLAGNGVHGLVIAGGASTIRGLVIGGFGGTGTGDGIHLQGAGSDVIEGNYIGSDVTGAMSQPNTGSGVVVDNVPGNTIGGSLDAARNLLSGNAGSGVAILGGSSTTNLVAGDLIGTAAGGKAALGNGGRGVLVSGAPGNTIGISNVFPNIISGNGADGVLITGGTATGTILRGNYVGVDVTNTVGIRNGLAGVRLESSNATVGGSTIGQRNQIGFNGTTGVTIVGGTGNRLMRNGINSDVGLGIDLGDDGVTANDPGDADTGANGLQNDPVLTKVITDASSSSITGTFNSKPATTYTIEFTTSPGCDLSGFGEGKQYFMSTSLTTDAGGNATIALSQPIPLPVHVFLTATATDPAGNTSEYSNCVRVSDQTPDEIAGATWSSTTELDWTAGPGVTSYNVYRGQGSFLPNLLNSAMESCQRLVTGTTTTGMILTELPPQGQIYWYLIDGVNSFGEGTVGDATAGPRSLDSFGACPTCAHEKCAVGGPLSAACNPCVASVCAVNPACCTTQWTSTCVGQVLSVCGSLQCPTSAGACAHLQCVTGSPLSNACDSPPVSPSCVTTVCGADPACCSLTWDATCVEEVGTTCSKTCN
ncbi:MAG TPA: right-handed parallel beta-helix repeat-containing protein, partial [Candidatus Polarisedimenticolia bacterium]|nr:right-handed parallel beta-helix repeat-containing protein [Candidatus Polarisedimenticolia bacterium]